MHAYTSHCYCPGWAELRSRVVGLSLGFFDPSIFFLEKKYLTSWFNISEPVPNQIFSFKPKLLFSNGIFFSNKNHFPSTKSTIIPYALFGCVFSEKLLYLVWMCPFLTDTNFLYIQPLFAFIIMKINKNSLSLLCILELNLFEYYTYFYSLSSRYWSATYTDVKYVLPWEAIVHQSYAPRGSKFVLRNQCWHWAWILYQIIILWLLLFFEL